MGSSEDDAAMAHAAMAADDSFTGDGSDWTLLYVIIGLIPIIFVAVAVYSTWSDRRRAAAKKKDDLETGRAAKIDRYFHPWRFVEEEGQTGEAGTRNRAADRNTNHHNSAIVATTASRAAAPNTNNNNTSRHNHRGFLSPRGHHSNSNSNSIKEPVTPVTPWLPPPPSSPQTRQQQQQQQQQQQNHQQQQSHHGGASPYLPKATTPMYNEADAWGHTDGAEEQSTSGNGGELRWV